MKPLTIDSFKPDNIRAVSSDQKSVDNLSYTSVKFEYDRDKIPPLRIDGSFRIFKFKNSKGTIYSLSINCDESLENFFNELREVIANQTCKLVPKVNGKRLSPDSFELVKSSKHGQNLYAKIYNKASGKAKRKVSKLVDKRRVSIPLEELIDESFEGSCILKLYQAYVGSTKSISLSVEEILVTDRETSSSYFEEDSYLSYG